MRKIHLVTLANILLTGCIEPTLYPYEGTQTIKGEGGFVYFRELIDSETLADKEYKFRDETDIQDFIKYLETSEEAFESYYQFSVDQNKYGYGLTNKAIDNVVSQCQKFIEQKENHYLVDI